jgi:hypothetical protein
MSNGTGNQLRRLGDLDSEQVRRAVRDHFHSYAEASRVGERPSLTGETMKEAIARIDKEQREIMHLAGLELQRVFDEMELADRGIVLAVTKSRS